MFQQGVLRLEVALRNILIIQNVSETRAGLNVYGFFRLVKLLTKPRNINPQQMAILPIFFAPDRL